MAIHCQLLFATILYILVFCNSIIELSTIINGKSNLNGYCFLYISVDKDVSYHPLSCNFIIYVCGGVSIYAAIMAIYHGFGTYTASRDSHIGRTMWVMPWLLLNTFLVVLMFICSCIYSVGLFMTCSKLQKHREILSCGFEFKEFRPLLIAEISAWISVVLWISLVIIEAVRLRRNRRALAREVYVEPSASDVVKIGDIVPTA